MKRFEVQCEVWEVGRADRSGRVFVEAVERGKGLGAVFGVRYGEKFTSCLPQPVVWERVMAWLVEHPAVRRLGVVVGRWPVRRSGSGVSVRWVSGDV